MSEPPNCKGFAASRRVFDQVAVSGPVPARVGDQLAHTIELLVARENQKTLAGLAAPLVLLLDFMDELADEVEHTVARPGLFPQIGGGVPGPGRRHRWVAGAA